jgi:hypothetical protein
VIFREIISVSLVKYIWQRPQQLQDPKKNPSFPLGKLNVVGNVEEREGI